MLHEEKDIKMKKFVLSIIIVLLCSLCISNTAIGGQKINLLDEGLSDWRNAAGRQRTRGIERRPARRRRARARQRRTRAPAWFTVHRQRFTGRRNAGLLRDRGRRPRVVL